MRGTASAAAAGGSGRTPYLLRAFLRRGAPFRPQDFGTSAAEAHVTVWRDTTLQDLGWLLQDAAPELFGSAGAAWQAALAVARPGASGEQLEVRALGSVRSAGAPSQQTLAEAGVGPGDWVGAALSV